MLFEDLGNVNLKHEIYMYVCMYVYMYAWNVITDDVVIDDNIDER